MGARRECVVIADDFKGHGKELFCVPRWFSRISGWELVSVHIFLPATMWTRCRVCWFHTEWSRRGSRKWQGTYWKMSFRWIQEKNRFDLLNFLLGARDSPRHCQHLPDGPWGAGHHPGPDHRGEGVLCRPHGPCWQRRRCSNAKPCQRDRHLQRGDGDGRRRGAQQSLQLRDRAVRALGGGRSCWWGREQEGTSIIWLENWS